MNGDITPVLAAMHPPPPTLMRRPQIYGHGLLADSVTVATDVECHCGKETEEETGDFTEGTLKVIHSICTYLSDRRLQSRTMVFSSRLTGHATQPRVCSLVHFLLAEVASFSSSSPAFCRHRVRSFPRNPLILVICI